MNKLAIPGLLLGVVMIAGAFAFMPVQEASTVHTTVQGSQAQMQQAEDANVRTSTGAAQASTVTIGTNNNTPFIVESIIACATSDADSTDGDAEVALTGGITVDGSLMTDTAGDAFANVDVLANTTNGQPDCIDVLEGFANANTEISNTVASDGGDIVFTVTYGDVGDRLDSVKVVAFVDGSSTLTVVSGVPA